MEADTREVQDQRITWGDALYPKIQQLAGLNAGKITGMLLELGEDEVEQLLTTPTRLEQRVREAEEVLKQANLFEEEQV
jgi:polyadenylate-binding protein